MRVDRDARPRERWLGLGGVGALAAALVCAAIWPRAALTGWLGAAVVVQAIPTGAVTLLAMMRLIRGEWEVELRPVCEAGAALWPLAAAAFVPVLIGMGAIYDWQRHPPASAFAAAWLGYIPFALRTIAWFVALAMIARSQAGRQASERASIVALVVLTIGGSLVAIDWLMSLDPGFHSSAFGLQLLTLEVGAAFMVLLIARLLAGPPPARPQVLGGLLLTLLLLWFYFQFLTYLIAWSANLPDSAGWYLRRATGGWGAATAAWSLLGLLPLAALLLRPVRTAARRLIAASGVALFGKVLEFAWLAIPGLGWPAVLAYCLAIAGFACLVAAGLAIGLRRQTGRRAQA